jgi:hypothetical protein
MFCSRGASIHWSIGVLLGTIAWLAASATPASAMGSITGSTTWGTTIQEVPGDQLRLENLIGRNQWNYRYIKLDGVNNRISINVSGIAQELDLDTGRGHVAADLGVASFGIRSQGYAFWKRRYVFVRGSLGGYEVELRLDYQPGMGAITTASAKENVAPTRCQVLLREPGGDEWLVYDGSPGE